MSSPARLPTLFEALIPVCVLIALLASSVALFGDGSSSGPNQIALLVAAGCAAALGIRLGYTWQSLEEGIVHGISLSLKAVLILLVVGALIGVWIAAGVVPTMIDYGLRVLAPSVFYAASCVIAALAALATGSSWTTASTLGIALIGIAAAQDLSLPLTAGAIISGSYFGDKMSPLSDTTNLAPAMAGTELFTHIRHMMWTTTPSLVIALGGFLVAGWLAPRPSAPPDLHAVHEALAQSFAIGPHLLLPVILVLILVIRRMPALPALALGTLVGAGFAYAFQAEALLRFIGDTSLPRPVALLKGIWTTLFEGFKLTSDHSALNDLLSRGGMASMLNTVWLIVSAMVFGAVMERTQMLARLAQGMLRAARSVGGLISATLATSVGMNVIASDQYIAIVLPGRMFRTEYHRRGLHPKNLSRALEDAGTLTSPLVPWNTCGAFMSQTLGVATMAYLPFCFFNLLNPLISAAYGATGFTIEKLDAESSQRQPTEALADLQTPQ